MSKKLSDTEIQSNNEGQVSGGFVLMHRGVRDHWIWNEPHSSYQAFSDLIFSANWCEATIRFDGQLVALSRGQFVTSELKLADSWKWSRGKVARFLKLLIQDKMIQVERISKGSIVTINNYEKYQSRTGDGHVTGQHSIQHSIQHTGQHSDTVKELKQIKQIKETNNNPAARSASPLVKTEADLIKYLEPYPSLNTDNLRKLLLAWIDGPRKLKRAPLSFITLTGIIEEYQSAPELLVSDLKTCLENGWQGLKWAKERRENFQNSLSVTAGFSQKRTGETESPEAKENRLRAMAKAADEENRKIAAARRATFGGRA